MYTAEKRFARLKVYLMCLTMVAASLLLEGCFAQANSPNIDSAYAFSVLKKQCDFGPRPMGVAAHTATRDYLYSELGKYASAVELQNFSRKVGSRNYALSNIVAHFGASKSPGILLCAHWDTRPIADQELESADKKKAISGANDGASGVAVLVALAKVFHDNAPQVPVSIALFDGEDFGPTGDDMYIGSTYFAKHMNRRAYKYGILLDMVGDSKLEIYREGNSEDSAKQVTDNIWQTAAKLGFGSTFRDSVKYTISDDHLPLIEAGLPCADVIDFDYAYWHTLKDTVDKCSPESLRIVGKTIAEVVYSERTTSQTH